MRTLSPVPLIAVLSFAVVLSGKPASGQNTQDQSSQTTAAAPPAQTPQRSPGGDIGSGAGDVGKGTARGAGAAAAGVGKGAADLVTLHPLNAAGNVGKGAAVAGKDVGVGAVKGTGKIAKGTGRGIGKIFHHRHNPQTPADQSESPN